MKIKNLISHLIKFIILLYQKMIFFFISQQRQMFGNKH